MRGQKLEISTGSTYGNLTVIEELPTVKLPSGQYNRMFKCRCECGKDTEVRLLHLVRLRIRSCGCLLGESHLKEEEWLYNIWRGMRDRCRYATHNRADSYYHKGVTIFEEWDKSFNAFRSFALANGAKNGLSIDRIENNKGYYPSNCRFTTDIIQANNKDDNLKINYDGEIVSLGIVIHKKNLSSHYAAIYARIKRGWEAQKAIDTPIRKGNYKRNNLNQRQ